MARTTGTKSLADLLESGVLLPGERLVIRRRSASAIEGVVRADGKIQVGSHTSGTPSAAARTAMGVGTADGWLRWRVVRLDKTLSEVRDA